MDLFKSKTKRISPLACLDERILVISFFEKSMSEKLASEILSAFKEEGAAVKKRVDTHKMAESNKAFAHFRW